MPVEDPWSRWAGLSSAERSQQRRQLIIDAAFTLVAEGGLGEVTIRAVSRLSEVHRRYFRENFESRDELLSAMFDTAVLNITNAGIKALKNDAPTSVDQSLRTVIRSGLSYCLEMPAQFAVIFAALDEPVLRSRFQEASALFRPLISQPPSEGAVSVTQDRIVATFLEGGIIEFGKRWMAGEFGDDIETATEVSATAVLELMKLNHSIVGADERAASMWRSVTSR